MTSDKKLITVELVCGLCNRLRAIEGVLTLADEIGARTRFFWFCNPDLNARFTDLFEPLDFDGILHQPFLTSWTEKAAKRLLHGVYRRRSDCYLRELEIQAMLVEGHDFSSLREHDKIFLKTWDRIRPVARPYSMFRPVDRLMKVVESYQLKERTSVGVHIRRTDHPDAPVVSTTEAFFAAMREVIERLGDVQFFLATDDLEEEERVRKEFPGRVISHPKRSLNRNDRVAIEDAVIDLYSLGSCDHVIGSAQSSFTDMAASLTGNDLVIAGEGRAVSKAGAFDGCSHS